MYEDDPILEPIPPKWAFIMVAWAVSVFCLILGLFIKIISYFL